MKLIFNIIRAMRPQQWVKNFLVFAALVFSKNLLALDHLVLVVATFGIFCLLSGSIYLYNDLKDVLKDRQHPIKCHRPIASGQLSERTALIASIILASIAVISSALLAWRFELTNKHLLTCVLAYLALQICYTKWLKHMVIIDVMSIAAGFLLRMVAGGTAISIYPSTWVLICTTLLALFLGFGKRRHEIMQMQDKMDQTRTILKEYSPYFLDQMISVVTASTVVAYSLYTMDEQVIAKLGTENLNLTIPFVLFAIFRYLYLVHQKETGGNPTQTLLTDPPILVCIGFWFLTVNLILYFN